MAPAFRMIVVAALALLMGGAPGPAAPKVASQIDTVLGAPEYTQSRWGVLVADAETGQVLYQRNPDQGFVPGSTLKVFTCAAALAVLGADYRFQTPVYAVGAVMGGKLQGDLVLVASGDPTLGGRDDGKGRMAFRDDDHTYANSPGSASQWTDTDALAGLRDLARQIRAAGIREVRGDVLVDDRLFARTVGNGNGPKVLSPIVINDNVVDLFITPANRVGMPAELATRPRAAVPDDVVHVGSRVRTGPPGSPTRVTVHDARAGEWVVEGQIPLRAATLLRVAPVDDPARFARAQFLRVLDSEGVRIAADPQAPRSPLPPRTTWTQLQPIAVHRSLPLSELIRVTLKTSSNVYANTLPLILAAHEGRSSLAEGLAIVRREIEKLGVDMRGVHLTTGAGTTLDDRLTPRAVVQALQKLSGRPEYAAFRDGLPVLGEDGTLADAVAGTSRARGKVQAKTGTYFVAEGAERPFPILHSKALAGTMTTASGRPLVFALFVNDVVLPRGVTSAREGRVLGRICEILYQDTPRRGEQAD